MASITNSDLVLEGMDVPNIEPVDLIGMLTSLDVEADRTDTEALEIVAAWEKVRSWAEAQAHLALADFLRRPETFGSLFNRPLNQGDAADAPPAPAALGECIRSHPGEEFAVRCGISIASAGHRVGLALALADRHRATWEALSAAAIDGTRAAQLVAECLELCDESARIVEAQLLPLSSELDAPRWRQAVRRSVIAVDPRSARQRHERAQQDRQVRVRAVENGMAELWALLPAEAALAIATALDARARSIRSQSDPRTLEQLRADVLVEVFDHALRTGELVGSGRLGSHQGHRAHLHVTVPLSVLLGIDDSPAELHGYGPITAEVAREIATDATWRRILTDPANGAMIEAGAATYKPPAALQRHVEIRDGTCRFPGCARSAEGCDLDHTEPYPHGSTDASNLGALCRRHHLYKHGASATGRGDGRLRLVQNEPGVFTWRMPTGATATVKPEPIDGSSRVHDRLMRVLRRDAA